MTSPSSPLPNIWQQTNEIAIEIHRSPHLADALEVFTEALINLHLTESVRVFLASSETERPWMIAESSLPAFVETDHPPESYEVSFPTGEKLSSLFHLPSSRGLTSQLVMEALCEHINVAAQRVPLAEKTTPASPTDLTNREKEVLPHLLDGKSNSEIGDILGISPRTVEKHVTSVLRKYQCATRVSLLARGHQSIG